MKLAGVTLPNDLAQALRGCRKHFVAAATFSFFINLLFLAPAIYMLQIFDRVVATGGYTTLFFITLALAIALITLTSLDAIRGRLLVRASARLDAELAPVILKRMLSAGGSQNLQSMRDFDTVRQVLGSPIAAAVLDAPWVPVFIIVAFLLHFWIGVLAVVSVALLIAIAWRNQRLSQETVEIGTRALSESHASGQAAAMHGDTVRALGMTNALAARQLAQRSLGLSQLATSQFSGSRYSAISRFVRLFVQSASLAVGALLAIAGEISAGAIIAGSILLGRALQPVDSMVGGWSTLSGARAALARLAESLGQPSDADRIRTQLPKPQGRLALEQVGVRTPEGTVILFNISFALEPGEVIGIIGPSGSGKTTLAKVIVGAVEPQAGTVRIDGAQRSDWDPNMLGRHIGYLPQEPSLLEGTISDNISRFSRWNADGPADLDAQVVAAAKMAGVHELILQLPQGYDTRIGQTGAGLSAGQSQRIALARAFFGDPSLLVLDEPNAFLDAEGEAALMRGIVASTQRGATVLIVAHRPSVLESAGRLLVLESGRIKFFGPKRDVIAKLTAPRGKETVS